MGGGNQSHTMGSRRMRHDKHKYHLDPSIQHLKLPLYWHQKPIKSGSWCVICCKRIACSHLVHMVEHLLKKCLLLAQRTRLDPDLGITP